MNEEVARKEGKNRSSGRRGMRSRLLGRGDDSLRNDIEGVGVLRLMVMWVGVVRALGGTKAAGKVGRVSN